MQHEGQVPIFFMPNRNFFNTVRTISSIDFYFFSYIISCVVMVIS